MSSDQQEPAIDVPDAFYEAFDGDIEKAQRAPTSTDPDELPRCTDCDSTNISRKAPSSVDQPDRKAGDWRCQACGAHFAEPKPPRNDEAGEQVTLEEAMR
jgi:ribosomal protein L37AE/L43A